MRVGSYIRGLGQLFFPALCLNCRRPLARGADLLCLPCGIELPPRDDYAWPENEVTDRLAGRLKLQFGAGAYTFREGNVCQRLIHDLKYHSRPDVGRILARRFGERLAAVAALEDVDGIVPVPIHRRRRHERGYNQAEAIAGGLADVLNKPVYPRALRRREFRGSQTRRGKLERLENVRESFAVDALPEGIGHLLLVDDVLTTGATLDFCGNALLAERPRLRLSVATLAVAER